jgi:hypothetical protein
VNRKVRVLVPGYFMSVGVQEILTLFDVIATVQWGKTAWTDVTRAVYT